jgi:hypothetical protein
MTALLATDGSRCGAGAAVLCPRYGSITASVTAIVMAVIVSFTKMTNPCKDCEERQLGCHSDCEKYLAFYQQNREKNKKQLADAHANQYVVNAIQKCRSGRSGSWKTYRKVDEK